MNCYLAHTPYNSAQHALRLIPHSHHENLAAVAGFHHRVGHVDLAFVNLGVSKGMCPLRGERARGLAPSSAGAGEASFRADPATVGWFKSSRQLHTMLVPARSPLNGSWRPDNTLNLFPASTQQGTSIREVLTRRLLIGLSYWCRRINTVSRSSCFESARLGSPHDASWRPNVSPRLVFRA